MTFQSTVWDPGGTGLGLTCQERRGAEVETWTAGDCGALGFVTQTELECYLAERVKVLTEGRRHPTVTKPKAVHDYRMFRVGAKAL